VTWGGKDGYQEEAEKYRSVRYSAGMPSTDDGSLLFLQTMLAKMKPATSGGSRIAIIFNGSPLSNGDCGSGESEIRRWILENDWLDAIVMLPDQLFYNTGIFTYVWLLTNHKPGAHKNRVMLIDGRQQFDKEPKSFGNKRNRILEGHRTWMVERYREGWVDGYDDEDVRFYTSNDFAFHKVEVVFWETDEVGEPAIVTESFPVQFKSANVRAKQEFYDSEIIFHIQVLSPKSQALHDFDLTLGPNDKFLDAYKSELATRFAEELPARVTAAVLDKLETKVSYTHRHYIKDDEYIPFDVDGNPEEYIPAFLDSAVLWRPEGSVRRCWPSEFEILDGSIVISKIHISFEIV
jgi:type I restriction enzyme M protein